MPDTAGWYRLFASCSGIAHWRTRLLLIASLCAKTLPIGMAYIYFGRWALCLNNKHAFSFC